MQRVNCPTAKMKTPCCSPGTHQWLKEWAKKSLKGGNHLRPTRTRRLLFYWILERTYNNHKHYGNVVDNFFSPKCVLAVLFYFAAKLRPSQAATSGGPNSPPPISKTRARGKEDIISLLCFYYERWIWSVGNNFFSWRNANTNNIYNSSMLWIRTVCVNILGHFGVQ